MCQADSKQTLMLAAKGTLKNNTTRQTETVASLLMRTRQKKYSLTINYLQTLHQFAKWQRLSYEGNESYKAHRIIDIIRRGESEGPYDVNAKKT